MPPPALPPSGHSGTAPIDLFQLPSASSPPLDFFSAPQLQPPSKSTDKLPQTFQPSTLDLFSGFDQNQPVPTGDKISPEPIVTENGGWATFDNIQPVASTAGTGNSAPSFTAKSQISSPNTQVELQAFQNTGAEKSSSVVNPELQSNSPAQVSYPSMQYTWNAFGDSAVSFATEHMQQFTEPKLPPYNPLAALDMQSDTYFQPSATNSSSHPGHPMMEQTVSQAPPSRSTNPFEFPYDSDLEPDKMFLDMASLQSALPNDHLSSSFVVDASHSWFPQDPVMNYMPNPGGLPYATGPAPSPPLGTIPAQGPVASIGGNPFA
ncbi:Probable ADP-ribosylation factor GTPase-activating protein AGD14 [Linum perenne]